MAKILPKLRQVNPEIPQAIEVFKLMVIHLLLTNPDSKYLLFIGTDRTTNLTAF